MQVSSRPIAFAPTSTPVQRPALSVSAELDSVQVGNSDQDFVPPKLAQMLEMAGRPYYDEARDVEAKKKYYESVDRTGSPTQLFDDLSRLVSRTHREQLSFKPRKYLHPWVDLRPNLRLQSIYSPVGVATDDKIHVTKTKDFVQRWKTKVPGYRRADGTRGPDRTQNKKVDFKEEAKGWAEALAAGGTNALAVAEKIALVEGYKYYNAEHSVPQFVFDRIKSAKGDLHHLFTCERNANSIRQHYRFAEVEEIPENRKGEGWVAKEAEEFEPLAGKGAVGRATLYFLLRYPGKLGDKPGEYTASDVRTLLKWHSEDPVGLYELHRNQAIEEIQGNRNPLIDFPELAEKIDFTRGLGEWGRGVLS